MQVFGTRLLCYLEKSWAAPVPHRAAASGSPDPAPCTATHIIIIIINHGKVTVNLWSRESISKCPKRDGRSSDKSSTVGILYPIRRPMQCPILFPRVTNASSPTGPVHVCHLFCIFFHYKATKLLIWDSRFLRCQFFFFQNTTYKRKKAQWKILCMGR